MNLNTNQGVAEHSRDSFWDEYVCWKVEENKIIGGHPARVQAHYIATDKKAHGMKPMAFRHQHSGGHTTIGTVYMFNAKDTAFILEQTKNVKPFSELVYIIGKPRSLGGNQFERKLYMAFAGELECRTELGTLHECGGEQSWGHDFVFNDYTLNRHWYLRPLKDVKVQALRFDNVAMQMPVGELVN